MQRIAINSHVKSHNFGKTITKTILVGSIEFRGVRRPPSNRRWTMGCEFDTWIDTWCNDLHCLLVMYIWTHLYAQLDITGGRESHNSWRYVQPTNDECDVSSNNLRFHRCPLLLLWLIFYFMRSECKCCAHTHTHTQRKMKKQQKRRTLFIRLKALSPNFGRMDIAMAWMHRFTTGRQLRRFSSPKRTPNTMA